MIDKEKIIKGLEWHIRTTKAKECRYALVDCPYTEDCKTGDSEKLFEDVLALLKEQNNCENCAIAIEDRQLVIRCKDCKYRHTSDCVAEMAGDINTPDNWFCANGERSFDESI